MDRRVRHVAEEIAREIKQSINVWFSDIGQSAVVSVDHDEFLRVTFRIRFDYKGRAVSLRIPFSEETLIRHRSYHEIILHCANQIYDHLRNINDATLDPYERVSGYIRYGDYIRNANANTEFPIPFEDVYPDPVNEKAEELLLTSLTDQQRMEYLDTQEFRVRGNATGTTYILQRKHQINIISLDKYGNKLEKFCIVPDENVPVEDHMLAQKLIIENDERWFIAIRLHWPLEKEG